MFEGLLQGSFDVAGQPGGLENFYQFAMHENFLFELEIRHQIQLDLKFLIVVADRLLRMMQRQRFYVIALLRPFCLFQ